MKLNNFLFAFRSLLHSNRISILLTATTCPGATSSVHRSLFRSCNGELNVVALINIGTETTLHICTLHRRTWEGGNLDFIKIELSLLHFFIPNEHVYKVSMNKSKFKLILDFWLFRNNTGVKVLYSFYMYIIHYLFKINVSFFLLLVSFFYLYLSEVSRPILFSIFTILVWSRKSPMLL